MRKNKSQLLRIASAVEQKKPLTWNDIQLLRAFSKQPPESTWSHILKRTALPLSLALGFLTAVFPVYFTNFVHSLPSWTNIPPNVLPGVDYLWDLLGDPVGKQNVLYHLPNIALYAVGFFGVKKLFDAIDRRTWLDRVLQAKQQLMHLLETGQIPFSLSAGHSVLFIGNGDFIGMQFVLSHTPGQAITIAAKKPPYTDLWTIFRSDGVYADLEQALTRADGKTAGEYIFFPVKDDQIFLPSSTAYDLSPHKLDLLCQDIRMFEHTRKWKPKRIIIIGDRYHKSFVQSENKITVIKKSQDTISLESIAGKYPNVTLLDPTDIVLQKILALAKGRGIVFRATKEGLNEYKQRFYTRLEKLGYKESTKRKGILTIGYDLFEDQTEQQTLSRVIDDYYPVVLSKTVKDALIRNGYQDDEFLYVPHLVLDILAKTADEQ